MREGVRPARSGCPGSPPRHGPAQRRLGLPGWLAPWHLRRAPPRPRGRCQPPVEGLYALGSRGGGGGTGRRNQPRAQSSSRKGHSWRAGRQERCGAARLLSPLAPSVEFPFHIFMMKEGDGWPSIGKAGRKQEGTSGGEAHFSYLVAEQLDCPPAASGLMEPL